MAKKPGRPKLDKKDRRKMMSLRLPPLKVATLKMETQETTTNAIEIAIDYYLDRKLKTGIMSRT